MSFNFSSFLISECLDVLPLVLAGVTGIPVLAEPETFISADEDAENAFEPVLFLTPHTFQSLFLLDGDVECVLVGMN